MVRSGKQLFLHDVDHDDVTLSDLESPPDPARFRHAPDIAHFVARLRRSSTESEPDGLISPTRTAMSVSSQRASRAVSNRRIDVATRPLPTLLPNVLDARNSRFHAATAGRISMTTPLTGSVMLTNVLLGASPRPTFDTILPCCCRLDRSRAIGVGEHAGRRPPRRSHAAPGVARRLLSWWRPRPEEVTCH